MAGNQRRVAPHRALLFGLLGAVLVAKTAAQESRPTASKAADSYSDLLRYIPEVCESYVFFDLPGELPNLEEMNATTSAPATQPTDRREESATPRAYEYLASILTSHVFHLKVRPAVVVIGFTNIRFVDAPWTFSGGPHMKFDQFVVVRTRDALPGIVDAKKTPGTPAGATKDAVFSPDDHTLVLSSDAAKLPACRRRGGFDFPTLLASFGVEPPMVSSSSPFLMLRRIDVQKSDENFEVGRIVLMCAAVPGADDVEEIFVRSSSLTTTIGVADRFNLLFKGEDPDDADHPVAFVTDLSARLDASDRLRIRRRFAPSKIGRGMIALSYLQLAGIPPIF